MTIGTKEHYEILEQFENMFIGERFDKEDISMWSKGQVYQSGVVNKMYQVFISGYSAGRCAYIN